MLIVTPASLAAKQTQLRVLQDRRQRILIDIAQAKTDGDLRENFGYIEGLKEQGIIEKRLAEITEELALPLQVIDETIWNGRTVTPETPIELGHVVTVELKNRRGSAETRTVSFLIGGAWDHEIVSSAAVLRISYQSPIARRLLGRRAGDRFETTLGLPQEVKILTVRSPQAHAEPAAPDLIACP